MLEELVKTKQELEKARQELAILYEISNAMRTTLKLEEILYIILTGVTAHAGLGFNRALLFLINDKSGLIEGKMYLGPESGEEASKIWSQIEKTNMDLDDLISVYKTSNGVTESEINRQVKHLKLPINEKLGGILALSVMDGMPLHLTKETLNEYAHDPVIKLLQTEEVLIVPLKAKDKVNGIILADNFITKKPIDKDTARLLTMLSNQAGLAIENSQLYELTVKKAHSDSLTDLWNHGYFQYLLQEELEKSRAKQIPLSLITLDIDDFKVSNDRLGHQEGDQILRRLSQLLKNQSRKMDHVCRYGGEEFTIILPETDKNEACQIAERLRQDIEKHNFSDQEFFPNKKLTVSLGLASYPADGTTPQALIQHSDTALYSAKHKGKNTVCF